MFQVYNTRTHGVILSTPDLIAADVKAWQENELEIGVGYEPSFIVRYVQGNRIFHLTIEEQ